MTVISTDGASKLSRTVVDNVTQGMELLQSTTGMDLTSVLKGITAKEGATVPAQAPSEAPAAKDASEGEQKIDIRD